MIALEKRPEKWVNKRMNIEYDVWLVVHSEHPNLSVGNFIIDDVEKQTSTETIVGFVEEHPDSHFTFQYVVGDPENGSEINSFFTEVLRDWKIKNLCG